MNDLDELKRFVIVHARGRRIRGHHELLDRIHHDDGDGPGSWVGEWSRAARSLEAGDRPLEASRYYAMARFPFVDGPARQEALERCVAAFDRWRLDGQEIDPLDVDLPGGDGRIRCLASGLSRAEPRPLLLVMGGIVTVKEQLGVALTAIRRLGMAGIVAEMPGAGENTRRYGPDSWRMLSAIMDAVSDRADVARTYTCTPSFSGHLALRCAMDDSRIRGVVTAGAPVSEFFTDTGWLGQVPQITVETLAHMARRTTRQITGGLPDFALTAGQLAGLDVPVAYVASVRDEIIPAAETALLRRHIRDLRMLENDDVHGSPRHVVQTRLWCTRELLRMREVRGPQSVAIGLLWRAQRARQRLLTGPRH